MNLKLANEIYKAHQRELNALYGDLDDARLTALCAACQLAGSREDRVAALRRLVQLKEEGLVAQWEAQGLDEAAQDALAARAYDFVSEFYLARHERLIAEWVARGAVSEFEAAVLRLAHAVGRELTAAQREWQRVVAQGSVRWFKREFMGAGGANSGANGADGAGGAGSASGANSGANGNFGAAQTASGAAGGAAAAADFVTKMGLFSRNPDGTRAERTYAVVAGLQNAQNAANLNHNPRKNAANLGENLAQNPRENSATNSSNSNLPETAQNPRENAANLNENPRENSAKNPAQTAAPNSNLNQTAQNQSNSNLPAKPRLIPYARAFDFRGLKAAFEAGLNELSALARTPDEHAYLRYFSALEAAFMQGDENELIATWQAAERAWMDVRSPLQVAHPLEYYEDAFTNAVALEWDVRLCEADGADDDGADGGVGSLGAGNSGANVANFHANSAADVANSVTNSGAGGGNFGANFHANDAEISNQIPATTTPPKTFADGAAATFKHVCAELCARATPVPQPLQDAVCANLARTQLYICNPALFYGAEFGGLFSAQVVPNDEQVSAACGKKIFAFVDYVYQNALLKPKMRLSREVFDADFLAFDEAVLHDEARWKKVYEISTIGHEFGHIFFVGDDTERAMNAGGEFKFVEEFKATSGGLVKFFYEVEAEENAADAGANLAVNAPNSNLAGWDWDLAQNGGDLAENSPQNFAQNGGDLAQNFAQNRAQNAARMNCHASRFALARNDGAGGEDLAQHSAHNDGTISSNSNLAGFGANSAPNSAHRAKIPAPSLTPNPNLSPAALKSAVLAELVRRAVSLIAWQEVGEVRAYYCEGLIHLALLARAGVVAFDGLRVRVDLSRFAAFKDIALANYYDLAAHYASKQNSSEFLAKFAHKEGEIYLPNDPAVAAFVRAYYARYKEIANEII